MFDVAIEGNANLAKARIHAIVITRDRPETLRRCVATALASLGPEDMLTILDDSAPSCSPLNASLLDINSNSSSPTLIYISTLRAQELLTNTVPKTDLIWLSRTAPRDIAPLRNLSLLMSAAAPSQLTILIDDDIKGFDLSATYHRIRTFSRPGTGTIVGADIGGISEDDTITRLADALSNLQKASHLIEEDLCRTLFYVQRHCSSSTGSSPRYVSAGYLAFHLPREQMIAFPPGYNEDWLWCLLYGGNVQVSIRQLEERVIHDPPSVRRSTRADILFELLGDLVFYCLEERHLNNDSNPASVLTTLSEWLPSPVSIPSTRAQLLMDKAQSLIRDGISLEVLEEYGLAILENMLLTGDLHLDWSTALKEWCNDAVAKHRSIAAALRGNGVVPVINTLLQEGTL
jgi:hypothetical protein